MVGVELRLPDAKPATDAAMQAIKAMLRRGYIMLPEGEFENVIYSRRRWPSPKRN